MTDILLEGVVRVSVPVKRIGGHTLELPSYETEFAAGMDLRACLHPYEKEDWYIAKGMSRLIGTGFAIGVPKGLELQIRPRSGLALQQGVTVLNSPGTIDSDYRGEIKVLLVNHGRTDFSLHHGDRIAQAVLVPVLRAELSEVEELSVTARGEGGFGHTGRD